MLYALLDSLRKQYDLAPSQKVLDAILRIEKEIAYEKRN